MIVEQTNLFAKRDKNKPNFQTNESESSAFLGVIILSGYHTLPEERLYWSTSQDKIWSLCGNDGYPYKLELYQGKVPNQPNLPHGTKVVNSLLSVVMEKSDPKNMNYT